MYHTKPVNIEFPPAAVGGERSSVERRKHRTGEDHQKDGLDKKTNKEIAETTGLKYWEVRDYIQYIGLAGIREEMLGRKPGRRKKDGYNKGKDGPNADRHLCKTCIYRGRHDQVGNCSYIEIEGHSRGMAKRGRGVQARRQQQNAWLSNVRSCRKNVSESSRQQ